MELRRYWHIFLKRQRTLFWIVGLVVGIVILGSFIVTPVYQFSADIWVKSRDNKSDVLSFATDFTTLGIISTDLAMPGQQQLITQQPLIEKAIYRLKLEKRQGLPMAPQDIINPGRISIIMKKIGVKVVNLQNTQILRIEGYSRDPKQAVELANAVAQNFVEFYHELYREEGLRVGQFLKTQIPILDGRLQEVEKQLYDFRMAHNTSNITYLRERLLASLSTLGDGLYSVSREIVEAEKQSKQILAKLKKIPELHQYTMTYEVNPRIDYLRKKIIDASTELASYGEQVTPKFLAYKQYQARLDNYKQSLDKEVKTTFLQNQKARNTHYDSLLTSLINAEVNQAVYKARQQVYEQQIRSKKQELSELTKLEMEQLPLERQVEALQTAQKNLLGKIETAALIAEMTFSNAYVVSWAKEPIKDHLNKSRWFPKRKILLILSFLLSLVIGLWVIFLQEYLDDSIEDAEQAESLLGKEVLATLPPLSKDQPTTVAGAMTNPEWRYGIWQLCSFLKSKGLESVVLGCTSTHTGEDKSRVAASLALAFAQNKKQVMLVDLDFFHPALDKLWQLPPGPGIWEVMLGTHPPEKCVKLVGPQQLYLLPTGNVADFSPEKCDMAKLQQSLKELNRIFPSEVVLLNLPAIGYGEGAPFIGLADQTLMVIAAHRTAKTMASKALLLVERFHGNILGLILTGVHQVLSLHIFSHPVYQQLQAKCRDLKEKIGKTWVRRS